MQEETFEHQQWPEVSVVILNWNGSHYLQKFLPFLLASTYPNMRVVVVDNASADNSERVVNEQFPTVEFVKLPENYGFAKGYNEGLKNITEEYFVLLNSDVEVTPGWIEPVISLMQRDTTIGACQPKIRMYDNRQLFEYAGAAGGWIDALGYPFARGRVFDSVEEDNGQYNHVQPCFWASGAAFFVRANAFRAVGGFDEYFFAHQEEIDLCWRLQNAGYKICCQPQSVVYHVGGGTLPKTNATKTFLNFRNNLVMISKNTTAPALLWKIPLRLLLDWVAAGKLLLEDAKLAAAVLQAHVAFFKWLMRNGTKLKIRPAQKKDGVYGGSVVWAYYVGGRKAFKEIVKEP